MDYNKFLKIKTFILDVDGVFTNSKLLITEKGEFLRSMNVRDGAAMKIALKAGYRISIITKGNSVGVNSRLKFLGADPVYDAVENKEIALADMQKTHGIDMNSALYMGDDLADLVVFDKVCLSTCPSDAAHEVIDAAEFVSPIKGGEGCVRDIIERVLRAQGNWPVK